MSDHSTPYDYPTGITERVHARSNRVAYLRGYAEGKDQAPKPLAPRPPEVVHEVGVDDGWYIVQVEWVDPFGRPSTWFNAASFPDSELQEAEERAAKEYQDRDGQTRVRVIHVGKPIKEEA